MKEKRLREREKEEEKRSSSLSLSLSPLCFSSAKVFESIDHASHPPRSILCSRNSILSYYEFQLGSGACDARERTSKLNLSTRMRGFVPRTGFRFDVHTRDGGNKTRATGHPPRHARPIIELASQPPPPLFVSPFFSSSSSSSSSLRRARPPCAVVSLRISRHDREPNPMNIRSRLYPAQPCDAAFRPTGSTKRLRTTRAGITIISAILGWRNLFEGRILCENLKQRRREWRRRGKGVGSRSRTTSSKDSR